MIFSNLSDFWLRLLQILTPKKKCDIKDTPREIPLSEIQDVTITQ